MARKFIWFQKSEPICTFDGSVYCNEATIENCMDCEFFDKSVEHGYRIQFPIKCTEDEVRFEPVFRKLYPTLDRAQQVAREIADVFDAQECIINAEIDATIVYSTAMLRNAEGVLEKL